MTAESTLAEPVPQPQERLTVHERLFELVDPDSLVELGSQARHSVTAFDMSRRRPAGDGVVTGLARVEDRPVALFAQDSAVLGGSLGETHAAKIRRVLEWAGRSRMPVVGLLDSGGARIQEGVGALDGYGGIFRTNVLQSGKIPQISVILGPCAGGAVYSPALTDIVIMQRHRAGGVGVVHLRAEDEEEALALACQVLSYLPSSCWDAPPQTLPVAPEPMPEVPLDHREPYDVRGVVRGVLDAGSFLELQAEFAPNLVIGFGRVDGRAVGVVANQPQVLAGTLDIESAEKGARFVRLCDAFGLPLVALVDTPGFLPGTAQEQGAKLLYVFAEATVPRVTVVLRKAFGGAYIVMNSKSLGADAVFAWPGAELAVTGAEGAVDVIFRHDLAADPSSRDELVERYRVEATNAVLAAERMSVDEIVTPAETRAVVAATLRALEGANRPHYRHDNLPQ